MNSIFVTKISSVFFVSYYLIESAFIWQEFLCKMQLFITYFL